MRLPWMRHDSRSAPPYSPGGPPALRVRRWAGTRGSASLDMGLRELAIESKLLDRMRCPIGGSRTCKLTLIACHAEIGSHTFDCIAPLRGWMREAVSRTGSAHPTNSKNMITLQDLEDMFVSMRERSKWDVDSEMLWGYFFTDTDPKKLERVVKPLTSDGYRFVSIYETDDKSTHFLHVERIEKHTPQTLHARNAELYKLAAEYGLDSYDGMDVGPVEAK